MCLELHYYSDSVHWECAAATFAGRTSSSAAADRTFKHEMHVLTCDVGQVCVSNVEREEHH